MNTAILEIPEPLWERTWAGLRSRGDGEREAACIWAGTRGPDVWKVDEVLFFDAFDGGAEAGLLFHVTSREATTSLFALLRERRLQIIADVHTHPADWVDLSLTDAAHPIEYRIGLLALVLPNFAEDAPELSIVGVHEYLGSGAWRRLTAHEAVRRIQIIRGSAR